jgi:transposase
LCREQQDIQALHLARQRLVNHRTAGIALMRGLLLDRGIAFAPGASPTRRMIPRVLEDDTALTPMSRETIAELYEFLQQIDQRIAKFDCRIARVFRASEVCQLLARVQGIGPKTATALVAAVGDAGVHEWATLGRLAGAGSQTPS